MELCTRQCRYFQHFTSLLEQFSFYMDKAFVKIEKQSQRNIALLLIEIIEIKVLQIFN